MQTDPANKFLPASAVLGRYGISDMTLWRWLRDPKLEFPQPIRIQGRRYFAVSDLDAFDRAQQHAA